MMFVNRVEELSALRRWWTSGEPLGLVYGRRRVGKTWLISKFASEHHKVVMHTGGARSLEQELKIFSAEVVRSGLGGVRDLIARPFASWDDAFDSLASLAQNDAILVVLDEFPDLVYSDTSLESILRALVERIGRPSPLRILLCGSAVRTMGSLSEERKPLFGRLGLRLLVHPFRPHEAAAMLKGLRPADRALVWGLLGGTPLYLSWWDQTLTVKENLAELVCKPGGRLQYEGQLILATEADGVGLSGPVMTAIAGGRTRFGEIKDSVRTDPTRILERLTELRLVERIVPVTEDGKVSRRARYRIADNFLAFWLGTIDLYKTEIERGLGETILPVICASLDDFMGARWEESFRDHLRHLASSGEFGEIVAVGRFWSGGKDEIDAVCLAGRNREAVLVGEAKWAHRINAPATESALARKSASLPRVRDPLRIAICARDAIVGAAPKTLTYTAADIFDS
ncbi:MAG: ATP-binding protein [Actinomycetota bacterium]|nr:MAG: ATP-binding protein [Actinomycetota bacterium]